MKGTIATSLVMLASLWVWFYLLHGYSLKEMDWNQDGITTPGEILSSMDVGVRYVCKEGKVCTDYFAYKDGQTIRMDCRN